MFDPFFGIASIGLPFAVIFLIVEARKNATSIPSVGTCLVALFAGYGVFVWLLTISVLLFGHSFHETQLRTLECIVGAIAVLSVGVPFLASARRRRRRSSAES